MLKFFRLPFATSGDKTAVPDAVDANGNVSYAQGYGFDYQRQKTDPAAKNIERDKMNQVFFDITTAIAEIQAQGVPDFITPALNGGVAYSYGQHAIVKYSGELYISLAGANTSLPTDATKWAPFSATLTGMRPTSFRNKIINGDFSVNQRVVSGSVVLAAGAYGHDRWKAGAGGCTYTFASVNNVTTLTISAGTLMQVIEGVNLQSGTHVLSWTGTAQGRVDAGAYGTSGAVTGTAIGGTNQTIEFSAGTLTSVQYEPGASVSAFEHRPFSVELDLCRRYYQKSYAYSTAPGTGTPVGALLTAVFDPTVLTRLGLGAHRFPVPMRASPTIAVYGANGTVNNVTLYNNSPVALTVSAIDVSAEGLSGYITTTTNATANTGYHAHYTATAEI